MAWGDQLGGGTLVEDCWTLAISPGTAGRTCHQPPHPPLGCKVCEGPLICRVPGRPGGDRYGPVVWVLTVRKQREVPRDEPQAPK